MSALLQCPFCGYKDVCVSNEADTSWFVKCMHCGARGPWHDAQREDWAAILSSMDWNSRALEKFEGKIVDTLISCSPGIRVVCRSHPDSLRPSGEELIKLSPRAKYRLIIIEED